MPGKKTSNKKVAKDQSSFVEYEERPEPPVKTKSKARNAKAAEKPKRIPEKVVEEEVEEREEALVPASDFSPSAVPDWLLEEARGHQGLEEADADDYVMPRVVLLQNQPPPGIDYDESDLRPGMFMNSLTHEVLADRDELLRFIPVKLVKPRYYYEGVYPDTTLVCRSFDGKVAQKPAGETMEGGPTAKCSECIRKEWDVGQEGPPPCMMIYTYYGLLPDHNMEPIALSLKMTSVKSAKMINSAVRRTGLALYSHVFAFDRKKEQDGDLKWFVYDPQPDGFVSKDQFALAQRAYESYTDTQVAVHDEASMATDDSDDVEDNVRLDNTPF